MLVFCLFFSLHCARLAGGLGRKSQRVSYCAACFPPKQRHLKYASKFLTALGT